MSVKSAKVLKTTKPLATTDWGLRAPAFRLRNVQFYRPKRTPKVRTKWMFINKISNTRLKSKILRTIHQSIRQKLHSTRTLSVLVFDMNLSSNSFLFPKQVFTKSSLTMLPIIFYEIPISTMLHKEIFRINNGIFSKFTQ